MGVIYKIGRRSPLLSDEVVLHLQRRFRAISSTCLPSYRIAFQMPPLVSITLYVTNRRLLLTAKVLLFITQEIDLWFPGRMPEGRTEQITAVSVQKGLFGRCLEVRSQDPARRCRWLCSPHLTLRFFMKNPEQLESLVLQTIKAPAKGAVIH